MSYVRDIFPMKKRSEIIPLRSINVSSQISACDSSSVLGDTVPPSASLFLPTSQGFKWIRQLNMPVYIPSSL